MMTTDEYLKSLVDVKQTSARPVLDDGMWLRIPEHLIAPLQGIARRQRTSLQVIVAQALSDYVHRGL
jgi:hypothetical protein